MYGYKRVFALGALLGGVAGLIFAPKSGKELRGDIGEKSDKLKNRTCDFAKDVKERGKGLYEGVSVKSSELVAKLTKGCTCKVNCICNCEHECCKEGCCNCCEFCDCECQKGDDTVAKKEE